jgi:hypothetical protein
MVSVWGGWTVDAIGASTLPVRTVSVEQGFRSDTQQDPSLLDGLSVRAT